MFRQILVFSAFAAGLTSVGAFASERSGLAGSPASPKPGLQLAQAGDVEVYYDGRGRRVIVDAYTGEIIAIEPRRPMRRPLRERANPERYYLDDPEDMARLRRDRLEELGRGTDRRLFRISRRGISPASARAGISAQRLSRSAG